MPFRLTLFLVAFAVLTGAVKAQNTIDLLPGDAISSGTIIGSGTTVNVRGGSIGLGVDLSDGFLNIESGSVALGATGIPSGFTNSNNQVNLSGGSVGGFFQLLDGTDLSITGGEIESFGVFGQGTTADISGGTVSRFPDIFSGGVVNISGGDIFSVRVFAGGEVNFFGSEFFLDDVPVALASGEERVVNQRNVTLSGFLTDGSFIETDLNTTFGGFFSANPDGAATGARVTVTSVVPDIAPDGDFDDDGDFDIDDVNDLVFEIAAGTDTATFDLTGDGVVDLDDRNAWLAQAGAENLVSGNAHPLGDLNLDGFVLSGDLGLLLNNFDATAGISYGGGDINADSNVDSVDLGILANNFDSPAAAVAVPEPHLMPLLLVALAGLWNLFRCKMRGCAQPHEDVR